MPALPREQIGVALDMSGCPNRCRHCWLSHEALSNRRMTEDDLRWVVAQFREFRREGEERPAWQHMRLSTWVREPDYSRHYRHLYDLEQELSDLPSLRPQNELLGVWRLARDTEYAEWAYSIGVRVAQLSFFGMEKVTDWAFRRRGAFEDLLVATERLLAAGIRPRWQVFFTKRLLPDLPELISLADDMRLLKRCEALGGPFVFWTHLPSPDGEAFSIEHLRPTEADLERVPRDFLEQSEKRIGGPIGVPERKLISAFREDERPAIPAIETIAPHGPWFAVMPNFDLYMNYSEISPAYRLGYLKAHGLARCIDVLENDSNPGLHGLFRVPVSELARRFGRPH
ncbi:MAG: hypothetical protein JSV79_08615, partial [Armatimonadota bacterium]